MNKRIDDEVTPEELILFKKELEIEYKEEIEIILKNIGNKGKITYRKLKRARKSIFFRMFKRVTKAKEFIRK